MAEFVYRAVSRSACVPERGRVTAYSGIEAREKLEGMGYYVLDVVPRSTRRRLFRRRVTRANVLAFSVQLRSLLSSGVPVVKALEEIAAQEPSPEFRACVESVRLKVEEEGSLSAALAAFPNVFPGFYIGAFKAGEAGGTLPQVLEDLVTTLEKQLEFEAHVRQAALYPIFVGVLLSGVGVLYIGFVLPKILAMVHELGGSLPWSTRVVMQLSTWMTQFWFVPAAVAVCSGFLLARLRRSPGGRLWSDTQLLRMPMLGDLVQKIVLTKFAHFLSLLLRSGYELLPSLELVEGTVGNARSAAAIATTRGRIQGGESLSDAMRGLSFMPFVISMIAVGEKTGLVPEQLDKVAEYYEKEVDRALKKVLALLEPCILVVFGGFAAVIIVSTFVPMYQSMALAK